MPVWLNGGHTLTFVMIERFWDNFWRICGSLRTLTCRWSNFKVVGIKMAIFTIVMVWRKLVQWSRDCWEYEIVLIFQIVSVQLKFTCSFNSFTSIMDLLIYFYNSYSIFMCATGCGVGLCMLVVFIHVIFLAVAESFWTSFWENCW